MSNFNVRSNRYFQIDTDPIVSLDSVQLVREVKKHVVIYDLECGRDKFALYSAWEAVITNLLPDFPLQPDNQKTMIRNKVRNRWTWMRGTLRRDLTRKKWQCHMNLHWMQEMQFLVPIMMNRDKQLVNQPRRRKSAERSCRSSNNISRNSVTSSSMALGSEQQRQSFFPNDEGDIVQQPRPDPSTLNDGTADALELKWSPTDKDVNFLFTLLRIYLNLSCRQKTILRQIFHTFLRQ